jgi:hypothetical protein
MMEDEIPRHHHDHLSNLHNSYLYLEDLAHQSPMTYDLNLEGLICSEFCICTFERDFYEADPNKFFR